MIITMSQPEIHYNVINHDLQAAGALKIGGFFCMLLMTLTEKNLPLPSNLVHYCLYLSKLQKFVPICGRTRR